MRTAKGAAGQVDSMEVREPQTILQDLHEVEQMRKCPDHKTELIPTHDGYYTCTNISCEYWESKRKRHAYK